MIGFTTALALGYLASLLLLVGIVHLVRFAAFSGNVVAHGVLPDRAAAPVALLVAVAETGLGAAAVAAAVQGGALPALFAGAAALGVGFVLYLRALLRRSNSRSRTAVDCGCTPLATPVTPASLLPGGMLAIVAVVALAAAAAGPSDGVSAFGLLWGVTLALLAVLVPATVPRPAAEGGA